jgi:hypothetical protein
MTPAPPLATGANVTASIACKMDAKKKNGGPKPPDPPFPA